MAGRDYVRSQPDDGSQPGLLVAVERLGHGGKAGILEQKTPLATDPLQLVVVGLLPASMMWALLDRPIPWSEK